MLDVGWRDTDSTSEWDVIIVGAGAVGITTAVYLARRGKRVLLLEGGPTEPPSDYERQNAGPNTGKAHCALSDGRMKAFGGTTRLWGGQLVRFSAEDFDGTTDSNRSAWPLSSSDIEPYYTEALDLLKIPPRLREPEQIWKQATGADLRLSDGLRIGLNIWLRQPDFTKLFKDELLRVENLVVRTECKVLDLVPLHVDDVSGRTSYKLRIQPRGHQNPVVLRAQRIIIAAGTLENVAILKRSSESNPNDKVLSNRYIGKYFIDHLHRVVGSINIDKSSNAKELFDNIFKDGHKIGVKVRRVFTDADTDRVNVAVQFLAPVPIRELLRDTVTLLTRCFAVRGDSLEGLSGFVRNARILFKIGLRYLIKNRALNFYANHVDVGIEIEQLPNERSQIIIADDGSGNLIPGVDWQIDGKEMIGVHAFISHLKEMITAHGLGEFVPTKDLAGSSVDFLAGCHDANHHMGGTRYSRSAEDGVVDANSRVFGAENLYIAGASTFPSGSFANPTLTAIALSLRMCDRFEAH